MKRPMAFALALVLVFGVSFMLYEPERIEAVARETMDDEWVGYFFALEPFDGRRYATENGNDYDFGVPGVPLFVTITDILPGEPGYTEGSEFNYSVGSAVGSEIDGRGMRVYADDNGGSRYETGGDMILDTQNKAELYECYVYRTAAGEYYAEWTRGGYCGNGFGLNCSETSTWTVNGKRRSRTISLDISFEEHPAAEKVTFVWMDGEKNVLSRAEYAAGVLPETLTAPEHAALLITTARNADGTAARTLCTAEEARTKLCIPSGLPGLLQVKVVSLDWGGSPS